MSTTLPSLAGIGSELGSFSSTLQDYGKALSNVPSIPLGNGMSLPSGSTVSSIASSEAEGLAFALSPSRVAAFIIGILLIGGGILLFRQSQVVVKEFVKGVAEGAAAA